MGEKMKVLFIHPSSGYLEYAANYYVTTDPLLPPLGILYLGKILENNDHNVEVIDCNAEKDPKDTIRKEVKSSDAIGMTLYCHKHEQNNSLSIADFIREIDLDIPIIIGGPHSTLLPEESLKSHKANICVRGRGDPVINPIIEALMGKRDLSSIPNIYYKDGKKISHTETKKINNKLDELPFPARHLVDKYSYGFMQGQKIAKGRLTSIITARGCANKCYFCNLHAHIPDCSFRSAENIKKEINEISEKGYKTLAFVDDNFMIRKKLVLELMEYIKNNDFGLKLWIFGARADSAERSLYEKLREAGTEAILYGIESGSQEILDYYNKKLTIPQIKKAVNLAKDMGFFTSGTFIIGSPKETKKHINETIKLASSLPLDSAVFFAFHYTYKSKLWMDAVNEGKLRDDEYRIMPDKNRGLGNFTPEEIKKYTRKANINFFLNPNRIIRTINNAIIQKDFRAFFQGIEMFKKITTEKS